MQTGGGRPHGNPIPPNGDRDKWGSDWKVWGNFPTMKLRPLETVQSINNIIKSVDDTYSKYQLHIASTVQLANLLV
jgi:hypothetical protein